jgi:hypothetical protein
MVPNTPKGAEEFKSLTEKQLTRKSNCPSIKGNPPPPKQEHGVQKLALNIVHAVEFSRNGRTQVPVAGGEPISRGCFVVFRPGILEGP